MPGKGGSRVDTGSKKVAEALRGMEVQEAAGTGQVTKAIQTREGFQAEDTARKAEMQENGLEQTREFVCIGCPLGCNVTARTRGEEIVDITGNTCPRGADYVTKELTDPRRIVTSLVRVRKGVLPVVSVKTTTDIPKGKIMDSIRVLKGIELQAPVHIGDVVVEDVCGTGVQVVATGNVETK